MDRKQRIEWIGEGERIEWRDGYNKEKDTYRPTYPATSSPVKDKVKEKG